MTISKKRLADLIDAMKTDHDNQQNDFEILVSIMTKILSDSLIGADETFKHVDTKKTKFVLLLHHDVYFSITANLKNEDKICEFLGSAQIGIQESNGKASMFKRYNKADLHDPPTKKQ